MANVKEILSRIKSIEDTMKITNAMYLISSSKLKKARKNLNDTLPFFETLQSAIKNIVDYLPDISHKYFDLREDIDETEKKRGYIVITADKGLCGAYNHNVIKMVEKELEKHENTTLFVVGEVGRRYFARKNVKVDKEFLYTSQDPNIHRARVISRELLESFLEKKLDEIYIVYTEMVSVFKEEPRLLKMLPLEKDAFINHDDKNQEIMEFFPSPEEVITSIVPDYVLGTIYGSLIESYSSEQNARMTAMDASTKNAKDMLSELLIIYNRVRQAAITQEITEVVSGAKALKRKK